MTKAVQWRRGTTVDHSIFTGLNGEVTVDTDKKTLIVHDGATAGGFPVARADLSNVSNITGLALSDMTNVSTEDIASRGIAKTDLSNLTASADSTETTKGVIQLASLAEAQAGTESTKAITPATLSASLNSVAGLPYGYIRALTLSVGVDTDHDIIVGKGVAKSFDETTQMNLLSEITKKIDITWVEGNDVGGMPAPLTVQPSTTYHIFVITNSTTGVTDAGFDADISAVNLLNVASGFTKYRRVGSIITDINSNLVQFKTIGLGDKIEVFYTTPIEDLNQIANPNTWTSLDLSVPSDLEIKPYTQLISNGNNVAYSANTHFRSIGINGDGLVIYTEDSQAEYSVISDNSLMTDVNSQIEYKVVPQNVSYKPLVKVITFGYSDYR